MAREGISFKFECNFTNLLYHSLATTSSFQYNQNINSIAKDELFMNFILFNTVEAISRLLICIIKLTDE